MSPLAPIFTTRAVRRMALIATALAAIPTLVSAAGDPFERPPNLVLVLTDDQGYGDLGAHGNPMIRTPRLDRLHAESVRLTDFHVDPTCSPTRAALLTGRYSTRTGVWHTIAGRSMMRETEVTLAEALAGAGYRTGIFGKWHLGDTPRLRPEDQRFHETLIHGGGGVGQTPDFWGNTYEDDTYLRNGKPTRFRGYCTDVWFDNALRFIESNRDRPFFAYISTNAPHGPYIVPEEYAQPYLDAGVPQPMANFYGMITNIDDNMGRLRETLERLDLVENTILVFMTDNGSAAGVARAEEAGQWAGYNAGMRGLKGSQYEGGHRVPCFVRYPAGGIGGGLDVDVLTAHIDLYPTLLELCAIAPPPGPATDGTSLVPLLKAPDDAVSWPERTVFVHSQRVETPEKWRQSAVMTERWRLIDGESLYDIATDPGQTVSLADRHPIVVKALRAAYETWWASLAESFDEDVPITIGMDDEQPVHITCHDWHPTHGEVPWSQRAIRDAPLSNGFWVLEIANAGRYRVTMRQRPAEAAFPIEAREASVAIGSIHAVGPVPPGADSVVLEINLKAGPARMTTEFTDASGQSRGAYFVEIERLGEDTEGLD